MQHGLGHREDEIRASTALIALATTVYWSNPVALQDLAAADRAGLPIIILQQRGVTPPPGVIPARAVVIEWETREDLARLAGRIRAELYLAGACADPDERFTCVDGELPGFPS
jgi:hypothetical protein